MCRHERTRSGALPVATGVALFPFTPLHAVLLSLLWGAFGIKAQPEGLDVDGALFECASPSPLNLPG